MSENALILGAAGSPHSRGGTGLSHAQHENPHASAGALTRVAHVARAVLVAFLFTFAASRILVYLIMSRRLPDLFVQVGGTHIHHLNYGIFLLVGVGGYLLFRRSDRSPRTLVANLYGVGLALTFDEFGMWLHLNDLYWQRASFDAIVVITAVLGLLVVAPRWRSLRPRHWATAAGLVVALVLFTLLFRDSLRYADMRLGPALQELQGEGRH
jgi:hypothetical protein